jgi:hypothetical protein
MMQMRRLIPVVAVVLLLGGCVAPQRTDLTNEQRAEMSRLISIAIACDTISTVVEGLTFQKAAGNITPAMDQKVIAVLNYTDIVCSPGATLPSPGDLDDVLLQVRAKLAELQRIELEAKK